MERRTTLVYLTTFILFILVSQLTPSVEGVSLAFEPITATILGGASLLGGALSSIGSGRRASRQAKDQMNSAINKSNNYAADMQSLYAGDFANMASTNSMFSNIAGDLRKERATPYLDTVEGKSFLANIGDQTKQASRQAQNSASLMNLSPEAYLAMMNNINSSQSQSIRDLGSRADTRRNSLYQMEMGALGNLAAGQQNLFNSQYGINRDSLASLMGASLQTQQNAMSQQYMNQQNINNGLTNIMSLGAQAGWFG